MNGKTYARRGLIKRGLALVGGIFLLGAARSGFGATRTAEPREKQGSRARSVRQHGIEGNRLSLPAQD